MENTTDKTELLRRSFPGLESDELDELAALTTINFYPAGHLLCREGAYEDVFYVLAVGEADITLQVGEDGPEMLIRVAVPGDYFGEMALIQNTTRAASIRTRTAVTTLEMRKADFEAALQRSPRMAMYIMNAIIDRMRNNDQLVINELRRVNDTLKMLDRNKMEFIEIAAHELRTPITVMTGYTRMMQIDPAIKQNPMLSEVADGILRGTERLLEIVNAMLDVVRLTGDNVRVAPSPVAVRNVLDQLIHQLAVDGRDRDIRIAQHHPSDLPTIMADPPLISKALSHLLNNAIKYTPDGGTINVRTSAITLAPGKPGVQVEIADTGIGIDPGQHELIFEKFYQVGAASLHSSGQLSFKGGGPGVGLAIVRGVAAAHGGRVWVESPGHNEQTYPGSTFILQLPLAPPPQPPHPALAG